MNLPKYSAIARMANVSTMTVSNVLRGRAGVSEEKRTQVLEVLRQFGVDLNSLGTPGHREGVIGRKRRSKSFLLLESGLSSGVLQAPIYMELARGINERCVDVGRTLQVCYAKDEQEQIDVANSFHGEGVIFFGASETSIFKERDAGLAMVRVLGVQNPSENIDRVVYDHDAVGILAADWLMEQGCKRPAFIGPAVKGRGEGFQNRCLEHGIKPILEVADDLYILSGEHQVINHPTLAKCRENAVASKADGFFVHSDQVAVALFGQMYREGMRPMEDFPVISCNRDETFLSLLDPRPATIDIQVREIGRRAIDRLVARIGAPAAPVDSLSLIPRLVPPSEPLHTC